MGRSLPDKQDHQACAGRDLGTDSRDLCSEILDSFQGRADIGVGLLPERIEGVLGVEATASAAAAAAAAFA